MRRNNPSELIVTKPNDHGCRDCDYVTPYSHSWRAMKADVAQHWACMHYTVEEHEMPLDVACADLAQRMLSGVVGTTNRDIQLLAEELQHACEAAEEKIRNREEENSWGGSLRSGLRHFTGGKPK